MRATLYQIPTLFSAGETVEYTRQYDDYPATSWTLKLYLNGKSAFNKAAATNSNGRDFDVALTPADTATLAAGDYAWIEQVTEIATGRTFTVGSGRVQITPAASSAAGTYQSWVELALEAIEAAIKNEMTADQRRFLIDGIEVWRIPNKMEVRAQLLAERAASRSGGTFGTAVAIRLVPPGQ